MNEVGNINGMKFREVYVAELSEKVKVGNEDEYGTFMEGSAIDDEFACYVPSDVFNLYTDEELEEYVKENFYD